MYDKSTMKNQPNIFAAKQSKLSTRVLALTAALLVPVIALMSLSTIVSALAGINPENHDKVFILPVPFETAKFLSDTAIFFFTPLALVLAITAVVNLWLTNKLLHRAIIVSLVVTVCWVVVALWACSGEWVSADEASSTSGGSLQIRTMNIE